MEQSIKKDRIEDDKETYIEIIQKKILKITTVRSIINKKHTTNCINSSADYICEKKDCKGKWGRLPLRL